MGRLGLKENAAQEGKFRDSCRPWRDSVLVVARFTEGSALRQAAHGEPRASPLASHIASLRDSVGLTQESAEADDRCGAQYVACWVMGSQSILSPVGRHKTGLGPSTLGIPAWRTPSLGVSADLGNTTYRIDVHNLWPDM